MGRFSVVVATLLVSAAINGVVSKPTVHRDNGPSKTFALPNELTALAALKIGTTSLSNVTKNVETEITTIPSTEIEEGRGRKKKYKKVFYRHFWNIMYYYAWFVGIIIIKFKAVLLFLLGNLTFFIISLIRVLIKEVPMWNYLKKSSPTPSPIYGPPQYKYGPPSPTYGTPSSSYDNSYSPVGLYKRQGPDLNENAHQIAYSGQTE